MATLPVDQNKVICEIKVVAFLLLMNHLDVSYITLFLRTSGPPGRLALFLRTSGTPGRLEDLEA